MGTISYKLSVKCARNCSIKIQRLGRSRCFIIYHAVLLKFDFIVVAVMLQYALVYTRPLPILLQTESCDLMKGHQEARVFVLRFQGI